MNETHSDYINTNYSLMTEAQAISPSAAPASRYTTEHMQQMHVQPLPPIFKITDINNHSNPPHQ